jgi:hypothetical protein
MPKVVGQRQAQAKVTVHQIAAQYRTLMAVQ